MPRETIQSSRAIVPDNPTPGGASALRILAGSDTVR